MMNKNKNNNTEKYSGTELIRYLSELFGPTGCEDAVAEAVCAQLDGICRISKDRMGNVIARLNDTESDNAGHGKPKMMVSAHMDEVGMMIKGIEDEGYLRFGTLGGIDESVLCGRNVTVGDGVNYVSGVIASKAIHHQTQKERLSVTPIKDMYIDIGAKDKEDAEKYVSAGDFATFDSDFILFGENMRMMKGKALDDRLGCAAMIEIIRELAQEKAELPYDVYFCFTVREETGLSGAKTAAQAIRPDYSIVLESTAVADIYGVPDNSRVAELGHGGVVSIADRATLYDREFVVACLETAKENGIDAQIKRYVSGGNDASGIQRSGTGVRSLAVSVPARYIHSASCVASLDDYESTVRLVSALLRRRNGIC